MLSKVVSSHQANSMISLSLGFLGDCRTSLTLVGQSGGNERIVATVNFDELLVRIFGTMFDR